MSCVNPLVRTESGVIYPLQTCEMLSSTQVLNRTGDIIDLSTGQGTLIPCGNCRGCLSDRAQEWSNRLVMESSLWPENWFVTLTFDDEHLVEQCGIYHTLKVDHLQRFMKNLRREVYPDKIRFFACGEYGDRKKTWRPHYHLILFNLHLKVDEVHYLKTTEQNNDLFTSDLIAKCWPYGFNTCGSVTFESCGYVARYTLKKLTGRDGRKEYDDAHKKAPFIVMSRRPGIGHDYLVSHDWTNEPNILVSDGDSTHSVPAPKYLERYIRKIDRDLSDQRAAERKRLAMETFNARMSQTDLTPWNEAKSREKVLIKRTDVLTNRMDL